MSRRWRHTGRSCAPSPAATRAERPTLWEGTWRRPGTTPPDGTCRDRIERGRDMSAPATRPNVIVVFTDQQRWDSTGVHGNPLDLTPNFDLLARSGTHAAQTVTPQPVCAPARAALQTGQYPTTTGCFRNGIRLPDGCPTLSDHFGAAGY